MNEQFNTLNLNVTSIYQAEYQEENKLDKYNCK